MKVSAYRGVVAAVVSSIVAISSASAGEMHGGNHQGASCAEKRIATWRLAQSASEERASLEPRGSDAYEDTDVLHNALDIEVLPESEELSGFNSMTVRVAGESVSEFTFRLRENFTITEATVDGTVINVTSEGTTTRVAHLDRTYANGEEFVLTVVYEGVPEGRGFGSINFIEASGAPLVFSLSEPYYAYTWWPAKDGDFGVAGDNSDKATLEFSITAPAELTSVANGLLTDVEILSEPDRIKYIYRTDYELSTYLVFFSTGLYNTWNETYFHDSGAMPVNFYVTPDLDTTSNRDSWSRCVDMLDVLGEIYGPYPFIEERYGIYYFGFGGGMEHQTLTGQGSFGEYLTAHELGHQWWGDMVTCRTWQDIWLNEGFATYSEALWAERQLGGSTDDLRDYMDDVLTPFDTEGSVYVPEDELEDVGRIFSYAYTYQKAAWVVHMLRGVMGDELFFAMIDEYRSRYEYSAAGTEEFIDVCSDIYGSDLHWFFETWVYGTGAPTYRLSWLPAVYGEEDYLQMTLEQTQSASHGVFTMPVEIEVTTTTGSERLVVWNDAADENHIIPLDSAAIDVEIDPDSWILDVNSVLQSGYFPAGPIVVTAFPRPGDIIDAGLLVEEIVLTFDSDVQSDGAAYALTGAQTGSWALEHQYDVATHAVTLEVNEPLPPDAYTLTAGTTVVGVDSQLPLDGDIGDPNASDSLPSGDGEPDGAMTYQFQIVGQLPGTDNDNGAAGSNENEPGGTNANDNAALNTNLNVDSHVNAVNQNSNGGGGGGGRSAGFCGLGVLSPTILLMLMYLAQKSRRVCR